MILTTGDKIAQETRDLANIKDLISKKAGIYRITNIQNNMFYIGSSVDIYRRWLGHVRQLNNHIHENYKLQMDWAHNLPKDFIFEVLEFVSKNENEDKKDFIIRVRTLEKQYLDKYKPFGVDGYNISEDTFTVKTGWTEFDLKNGKSILTWEQFTYIITRLQDPTQKIVQLAEEMGVSRGLISDIYNKKYYQRLLENIEFPPRKGNRSRIHSKEEREKISNTESGKYVPREVREKLSKKMQSNIPWNKGKKINADFSPKAVICVELNSWYESVSSAARINHLGTSQISAACNGRQKTTNGQHWKYAEECTKEELIGFNKVYE